MHILDGGYRITFLNVRPGKDAEARRYLHEVGRATGSPVFTHWMMGPFDLLVVTPLEGLGDDHLGVRPLLPRGHSVGSVSLQTFQWDNDLDPLADVMQSDVVLVASLKLNLRLVQRIGLDAELGLLSYIRGRAASLRGNEPEMKIAALGSLGWYEIILILGCRDIEAMKDAVLSLRLTPIGDLGDAGTLSSGDFDGVDKEPILETSFSSIAFNPDWARNSRKNASEPSVDVRITVVCKPGRFGFVTENLDRYFNVTPQVRNPLGKGEFVFSIRAPFSAVASSLFEFRREMGVHLRETESAVEFLTKDTRTWDDTVRNRQLLGKPHLIVANDMASVAKRDPYVYDKLQQVFFTFNARMTDEISSDAFCDSVDFVERLASTQFDMDGLSMRNLSDVCDLYLEGMTQRFAGSYFSYLSPNTLANVRDESGISRVLLAADAVIRPIVDQSGNPWTGFAMFGLHNDFLRLNHGNINIPWRSLLRPEEWWQLFHEAGHEYLVTLDLLRDAEIKDLLFEYLGVQPPWLEDLEREGDVQPAVGFMWELISDLVDFYVCFQGDWDSYVRVTWNYLLSDSPERDDRLVILEQLKRTLLLRAMLLDGTEANDALLDLEVFAGLWRDMLDSIHQNTRGEDESWIASTYDSTLTEGYESYATWIEIERTLRRRLEAVLQRRTPLESEAPQLGPEPMVLVLSPVALVRDLARSAGSGEDIPFAARIAAILSLWSTYKRTTPLQQTAMVVFDEHTKREIENESS